MDEMDTEEIAFVVLRYGRPAAMFVPFEESGTTVKLPRIADVGLATDAIELDQDEEDELELDADQKHVLLDMAGCTDLSWRMDRLYQDRTRAPALLAALSRLELAGLVERHFHGGINLTRKGSRLARRLDSSV